MPGVIQGAYHLCHLLAVDCKDGYWSFLCFDYLIWKVEIVPMFLSIYKYIYIIYICYMIYYMVLSIYKFIPCCRKHDYVQSNPDISVYMLISVKNI